ncbi:MAG: class I SAM-dependent methyltransferase [Candidatus Hodarchaeales archaeon]
MRLDIGCGKNPRQGYIGIDKEDYGQEIIRDIEKECLPFSDSTIDEIFCQHVLEHLDDPMFVIDEFWRVLKPHGKAWIIVPHKDNIKAYALRHKRYFNEYTFDALETDAVKRKWKILEKNINDRPDIHIKLQPVKEKVIKRLPNELDIGCGRAKDRNAIGIDWEDYGQEIVWDITKGLPFSDDTFTRVKAHSVLEHLSSYDLLYVMRECHRVLKKDGILDIVVPIAGTDTSFRDPTHQSFFTENTFSYFTKVKPTYYDINPGHKFEIVKAEEKGVVIYAQLRPIK